MVAALASAFCGGGGAYGVGTLVLLQPTPLEERGVTIMGIREGQIAWGRLYLEETEREGGDITETVRRMAGWEEV